MSTDSFSPKPKWGQNFLVDRNVLSCILDVAELIPEHSVLEVGPGKGVLTEALAERCRRVFSIEIDRRLEPWLAPLEERFPGRVSILWGDARTWDYALLPSEGLTRIVANIPYSIMTPLLWTFISHCLKTVRRIVLLLEKEAMERLLAPPGTKARGPLGIVLDALGGGIIARHVDRRSFRPTPHADSVLAVFKTTENLNSATQCAFRTLLEDGFRHRRKTLLGNLRSAGYREDIVGEALAYSGFDQEQKVRAEELSTEDWLHLYSHLQARS